MNKSKKSGHNFTFGHGDAGVTAAFLNMVQEQAAKAELCSRLWPPIEAKPLTKYDHLYWDITDAWTEYRKDLHAYLFPEYAWAHDHIC